MWKVSFLTNWARHDNLDRRGKICVCVYLYICFFVLMFNVGKENVVTPCFLLMVFGHD